MILQIEQLQRDINELPEEAQRLLLNFIELFKKHHSNFPANEVQSDPPQSPLLRETSKQRTSSNRETLYSDFCPPSFSESGFQPSLRPSSTGKPPYSQSPQKQVGLNQPPNRQLSFPKLFKGDELISRAIDFNQPNELPEEAQRLLLNFIELLKKCCSKPPQKQVDLNRHQERQLSSLAMLKEAGLIGCINAEPNLSTNYKSALQKELNSKYDNR